MDWVWRRSPVRDEGRNVCGQGFCGPHIAPETALRAVPGQLRFHRKRKCQEAQAEG